MAKINLDALIQREDFKVQDSINPRKKKETISIEDLKTDSFLFSNIRKPDIQRETNEWTAIEVGPTDDIIERFASIENERGCLQQLRNNLNNLFPDKIKNERVKRGIGRKTILNRENSITDKQRINDHFN